jgi:hypothetical protein
LGVVALAFVVWQGVRLLGVGATIAHTDAECRVDDPTVVHGHLRTQREINGTADKIIALDQKRAGLADQDSYGTPINCKKI